jgi:hypothetical protein
MHRAENKLKNRSFTYVVEADPSVFDSRSFTGFLDQAGYHIQELRLVEKHTGDRLRMQVEVRFPNDRASRDTRRSEFETALQGYHAVCNVYDA